MDFATKTVLRHGCATIEHTEMDLLRREQCLCLNCAHLRECSVSAQLYDICVENSMALAVTRCPIFEPYRGPQE